MNEDEFDSSDQKAKLDRRGFFRMVGAATLPLVAQGCAEDEPEAAGPGRFRAVNPAVEVSVDVWRAKSNQSIIDKEEELSIDTQLSQYLSLGDQCRIVRDDGSLALYTVGEVRGEPGNDRIRMGRQARSRLGTTDTFTAKLQTTAVSVGLSIADAQAMDEYAEFLTDDGVSTSLVAVAPHGGWIEVHTDSQAELVQSLLAGKGASAWICRGYRSGGGAFNRWHITSTALSRNSFPGLDAIADRGFAYAVSFHGMSYEGVLVGGAAPDWLNLKRFLERGRNEVIC